MANFNYKVLNLDGQNETGQITAPSEESAIARLESKGLTVLSISAAAPSTAKAAKNKKVKISHVVAFTRQFSTMIKASVPILEGLDILAAQTESPALKEVVKTVARDIEGGASLSQALDKHPTVFSELYVNTIVAGEAGGVLDRVLEKLSFMMERDAMIAQEVKGALRYPVMTFFAIAGACLFLVTFVVPKFAKIYSKLGSALPLPTQILITTSNIIIKGWPILLPSTIVVIFLIKKYINTKRGRFQADTIRLKLPVFGPMLLKMYMLRFCSMLSILYESGLPILRTMEIVSATVGNVVLSKEIELMRRSVAEGKGLGATALESEVIPPLVSHMLSIGEKTGSFSDMLNFVGDYYELEIKALVKNLTTLIEPVMTAAMGGVVLLMSLAIFLPMWNMIRVFKR